MKTLIILRHGKSSWDEATLPDFERPLLARGKKRTQLIADHMKNNGVIPELIISSHAVRAFETAAIVAMNLNYAPESILKNEDLYFVSTEKYFETVYSAPEKFNSLMIVGHNPMITDFCNYFLSVKISNLPTSGLCVLKLQTDKWTEAAKCPCSTEMILFPKILETK